jgi:DNA-binding GntR family transcriptional regulator
MAPHDSGKPVRSVASSKHSAVDLVTTEIRRAILAGGLAPGQAFAVTDLASQLGVSHVPVREALRRLEAQGLVVLSPARRPMVAPLEADDLDAIYDLRLRLEPPLLARAMARHTEGWMAELDGPFRLTFDPGQDPDSQWDNHYLLHQALVRPAASSWELRVLQQLWDAAERYTRLVFPPEDMADPGELARRREAHQALLDAVRVGDPDGAAEALHEHLTNNLKVIRALAVKALDGEASVGKGDQ